MLTLFKLVRFTIDFGYIDIDILSPHSSLNLLIMLTMLQISAFFFSRPSLAATHAAKYILQEDLLSLQRGQVKILFYLFCAEVTFETFLKY